MRARSIVSRVNITGGPMRSAAKKSRSGNETAYIPRVWKTRFIGAECGNAAQIGFRKSNGD
jgi:hypothetical protein